MLAAVYKGPGKLELEERPVPEIKEPNEVKIKVLAVSVCGTDLHVLNIPQQHPAVPDIIMGHEYTGVVEEVGEAVKELKPGDHVVVDPHAPCGVCEFCREDRPDRCANLYFPKDYPIKELQNHPKTRGLFQDGAYTSYTVVPENAVFKISEKVPPHLATLAEPTVCVKCAVDALQVNLGDTVAILGGGPIGLLFAGICKAYGATKIIVSEPQEFRRNKAIKCGATRVVDPTKEDLMAVIMEETDGDGVDISIEAVGNRLMEAIDIVRNTGKVMQFGHDELAHPEIRVAQITRKDIKIQGAFIGKYAFKRVAEIMESGILPLSEIATSIMPLSRIHEAIDLQRKGKELKVIVMPDDVYENYQM